MSIGRFIKAAVVASALFTGAAPSFAQLNGPFYSCISTELAVFDGTIVDAAVATPELSTLVTAVTVAGLADTLATAQGITVYAPTDEAFAAVPAAFLDTALADTDLLTTLLTYHVTAQPAWRADPRRGSSASPTVIQTLAGQTVTVGFMAGGEPMVNQSVADCQGVQTDNGVVWFIDSVLFPQF